MADNLFIDSSSWVKRYVIEQGSDDLADLLEGAPSVFLSWISYAECLAVFGRKRMEKLIHETNRKELESLLNKDWKKVHVVRESEFLEPILSRLFANQPLRGADGIQLASAVFLRESNLNIRFVTSDKRLANIAREEKLKVSTPGVAS